MIADGFLQPIIDTARQNQASKSFYMGEDGFRHCSVCHCKIECSPRPNLIVPCTCDCDRRKEESERARKTQEEIERKRKNCFKDKRQFNFTFQNDNGHCQKLSIAKAFSDRWQDVSKAGAGLLLFGDVGTGKSYAAACIANSLLDRNISVKFLTMSDAINEIQCASDKAAFIDSICSYPLLILDDLGAERNTSYGIEQCFNIIDARCLSGKPLVCTTNLSLDELRNCEDKDRRRIYDRVLGACQPVLFSGESMRKEQAAENLKLFQSIIGTQTA